MKNNFISWSFAGKVAIVFGIIGGIIVSINWLIDITKDSNDIKATIEICDFYRPKILNAYIDSIDIYNLSRNCRNILEEIEDSIDYNLKKSFYKIDSLSNDKFKNISLIKYLLKLNINRIIENSKVKLSNKIESELDKEKIRELYNRGELIFIEIENTSDIEISNLQIETKEDGYYEVESNKKVTHSGFYDNIITLPPLRGKKNISIRIWASILFPDRLTITHPNGVVEPKEIIRTKGFYAWATKHLNSWSDFYFIIFPLYIVFIVFYSFVKYNILKQKVDEIADKNDNEEKNGSKEETKN